MASINKFLSQISQYSFTPESKESFEKNNSSFINEIDSLLERIKINPPVNEYLNLTNPNVNTEILWKHQLYKLNTFTKLKLQSVIFLQKHIRSFLSKNKLNTLINSLIIQESLPQIITIQKHFRQYYIKKHTKINLIIYSILKQRDQHYDIIKRNIHKYFLLNFTKKSLLFDRIIEGIIPKIIKLQFAYKAHYMHKIVRNIITIEREYHVLYYPFYAKDVKLKIYIGACFTYINSDNCYKISKGNYKVYSFNFCYIRNIFVLYLNKLLFTPGKYLCKFIIDGDEYCDGRFEIAKEQNGREYYNIIII